jgi:D-beta-D-heptose 7-phosphate kinase/D-beta-D-heptose 1-phosphate adenosyltransferase
MENNKIIAISGGFDPAHLGHVRLIDGAAEYGKVVVILNSYEWLRRKKGYVFMDWNSR